ncbi:MAG: hypothetical protein L6R41_003069 [Letrouitia leprolyta]|nr:MAG: hypothetical protein L6R41_003069 [Letrouitia leprolyta]
MKTSISSPWAPSPPEDKIFPFLRLSAEIRNQIYMNVIGPKVPRPLGWHEQCPERSWAKILVGEKKFWPDRKFNEAFFLLNHQIHREFFHILWKVLSVEWKLDHFDLDLRELALFSSMTRLQRCKLILSSYMESKLEARPPNRWHWFSRRDLTLFDLDAELTVFGLAHKLSRMLYLDEIHIEYDESESGFDADYFIRYQDGSITHFTGLDLKTVFGNDLRGKKNVRVSGNLCDECAAAFTSAMVISNETLPDTYRVEPEKCIPRGTIPQWSDEVRGWI